MSSERPLLTPDLYARAESRADFQHPVLDVIERNLTRLTELNASYPTEGTNDEGAAYTREGYTFMVDELVSAGPYNLGPEDLVAIWSRVVELEVLDYQRYALAGLITSVYAIQGLDPEIWKSFAYPYGKIADLPDAITKDKEGLTHVEARLM